MFNITMSPYMKKYMKENSLTFNTRAKATLLWNDPFKSWKEKLKGLKQLCEYTNDIFTEKQIKERVEFEEWKYAQVSINEDGKYVYLVEDVTEGMNCDIFKSFEEAVSFLYSIMYTGCNFQIRKHRLFCNNDINDSDLNMTVRFDEKGCIMNIFSYELEENGSIDDYTPERFEQAYVNIPCELLAGTYVKNCVTGETGVLEQSILDRMMDRLIENKYGDKDKYEDNVLAVYSLKKNGIWEQRLWNPLYLEPVSVTSSVENEEEIAYGKAVESMCLYFDSRRNATSKVCGCRDVIEKTKEYAELYDKKDLELINRCREEQFKTF